MSLPERLRSLAETLDGCEWNHPLRSADDCREAAKEIERLKSEMAAYHAKTAGEYWTWQGDGEDHPESWCNSLVVLIRAVQPRDILMEIDRLKANLSKLMQAATVVYERTITPEPCTCAQCAALADLLAVMQQVKVER